MNARSWGAIALVTLVTGVAVACTLNPQPLPPEPENGSAIPRPGTANDASAGAYDDASTDFGGTDGGAKYDGVAPGADASLDSSPAPNDAGDGGGADGGSDAALTD